MILNLYHLLMPVKASEQPTEQLSDKPLYNHINNTMDSVGGDLQEIKNQLKNMIK